MTATEIGNDIIEHLRAIPGTAARPENIRADDKTPPDVFPAIRVAYLRTEIEHINLRETPVNDPANIAGYTYIFNIRLQAEAYITDGDGFFADSAAPGLAEKIRPLPAIMFASNSRRRITWLVWSSGEYEAEETKPRPYVDMALSVEVNRGF